MEQLAPFAILCGSLPEFVCFFLWAVFLQDGQFPSYPVPGKTNNKLQISCNIHHKRAISILILYNVNVKPWWSKLTFFHLNVPNKLLSPKGLSALVYPMYSSLHPIFSLLFFSFASFFASLLALFSSGVSRAFIISFWFFLSSFSLTTWTTLSDPELEEESDELERRLSLPLTRPLLPSSLSSLLFLCSRPLSLFLSLSLSWSLLCLSLAGLLLSGLLALLLSLSLLESLEPLLLSCGLPLDFSPFLSFSLFFFLVTLGSSELELKKIIAIKIFLLIVVTKANASTKD